MNLKQVNALVGLLRDAAVPRNDAHGHAYTAEAYAEFREPTVEIVSYVSASTSEHNPEMVEIDLATDARSRKLFVSLDGQVYTWSSIKVPRDDRDDDDPVELECFRRVSMIHWVIEHNSLIGSTTYPYWRLRVVEGDPIYDVLGEYRAEKASS